MIHEVLLALLGHVGGLLYETEEGFVLSPKADFLTEAERNLIEHVVKVGFYCKRLSEFVAAVRSRHFGRVAAGAEGASSNGVVCGHYAYGMAQRIEAALDAYRNRVVDLEAQLLEEPSLPLAHVATAMEDDRRVLHMLHLVAERVKVGGLSGGPLLDLLWEIAAGHMGSGSLHTCLWSVVSGAGQVLANQLVAWAVYGRLVDPDGEFFIGRVWDQQPPWHPGSALYGGPVDDFAREIGAEAAQREWHGLFFLRPEAVPHAVVSLQTAEKALFVGKAVRVLLRSGLWLPHAAPGGPASATSPDVHSPERAPGGDLDPPAVQEEVDTLRRCFDVKSPTFVAERSIERIRASAASQLRRLVVCQAGLAQHLAALKGFYLLGYGAFYQTLLEASRPLLSRPPPAHAEAELLHGPWATAVSELEIAGEPSPGPPAAARQGPSERALAPRFEIRFVPRHFELQSFADAARQVRLVGLARLAGGHAELGLGQQGTGTSSSGGPSQLAMLWLATRQRVSHNFGHAFSFQVHAPPTMGGAGGLAEHGCRFALCFQHRWAPNDLQRWRQAVSDVPSTGSTALPEASKPGRGVGRMNSSLGGVYDTSVGSEGLGPLAGSCEGLGSTEAGRGSLTSWTGLGECLAVEIAYRVLPSKGASVPSAEVSLAVYVCHPGLGDGHRPAVGGRGSSPVLRLASAVLSTPAERGMVHLVRLWYDAPNQQLQVFFGADAVAPQCVAELDIGATLSLDLGCAYVGFCLLPLDYKHQIIGSKASGPEGAETRYSARDRPVSIVSWRHSTNSSSPATASAATSEAAAARQPMGVDAWFSSMELSYQAPWPLPLVITRRCIEQYNRLFRLLLAFKHVHLELQRLDLPRNALLMWALRSELSYFVSQVLLYFQQDVIEAAHTRLLQGVEASTEFNEVLGAHEEFLATLASHCFLKAPELQSALMAALRLATVFCTSTGSGTTAPAPSAELRRLQFEFTGTVRSVLRMMTSMHRQGMHTHLSQLLLRLDYNGYFSGSVTE